MRLNLIAPSLSSYEPIQTAPTMLQKAVDKASNRRSTSDSFRLASNASNHAQPLIACLRRVAVLQSRGLNSIPIVGLRSSSLPWISLKRRDSSFSHRSRKAPSATPPRSPPVGSSGAPSPFYFRLVSLLQLLFCTPYSMIVEILQEVLGVRQPLKKSVLLHSVGSIRTST